ncbi:MAG TPA: NADPH-dependent FMN reductase [Acidimicrobiia bacterium]
MACRFLLISGSLRAASTNSAVLRTAREVAPRGVDSVLYQRLAELPHFNPDDDGDVVQPVVGELRVAIHAATALVFSTPEYAAALPGAFKNFLDWTIGDAEAGSIYEKPAAWINTSTRQASDAHDELRRVLTYAHAAIVDRACVEAPVTESMIGTDGLIREPAIRDRLAHGLDVLAKHVGCRPLTETKG